MKTLLLTLLLLTTHGVLAESLRSWNFRVYLDDRPIGLHRFELRESGPRRELQSTARFDVKVLFFNAYQYAHDATEIWQGDCLRELSSRTDDNGTRLSVTASAQGQTMAVVHAKGRYSIPGCVMSFAYWNPLMLQQTRLLNAQTGEYDAVHIRTVGDEPLSVRGAGVVGKRYRITGSKLNIDLWYSDRGEWLALESTTDDGRKLRYVLSQES